MKNRILRSALSVALCAAMLLSQGLTAFADGEIDLAAAKSSPVQESSEELVPGASDLKPEIKNVVLPQRAARAAAPEIETYNVPNPTNYTEIFDYSALDNNCEIHIYTNASSADSVKPIDWNNKTVLFPNAPGTFPVSSGFIVFEANSEDKWVFSNWDTNFQFGNINEKNYTYFFRTAFEPNGSKITVNRLAAMTETPNNKIYYSVYANFNPTVSVTVNGASQDEAVFISPNNKVENTGRYEVDYGDGITITAKDGYEITAVIVDGEEVESVEGTSYTLTDVIEPHDIVVTVEKTGEEPEEPELPEIKDDDEILDKIVVKTECSENPGHNKEKKLSELVINDNYKIVYNNDESTATITLNDVTGIVNSFYANGDPHTASDSTSSPVSITLKHKHEEWSFAEGSEKAFTINVSCEALPVEPEEAIVQLVIYRNGDTSKPYKTVPLTKEDGSKYHIGDTFDLSQLKIDEHYTDSKFGFEFDGWYNDGSYKFEDSITINGWTNIHCMVTDYEKVQVRAVINGDKENAQVIFEGTALHGSDLNPYLDENKNSIREKIGSNYEVEDQWYNWDWYGHPIGEDATVNGWTNVYVNCTSEEVVQLVIYRNGNTEKPYQNIVLEPALMGSTLEIDFDINDYYTQEDYGAGVTHFDFDGWYNDGGWNDYKAGNPNNTLPDSITINGWTNIIGMVNDYEKIIVHTVINGDTKNAKQYYVGEALHGTSLLNFLNEHKDETMPSLEGYTTNGKWYNLDHPGQEITDQTTVNGWTNLYVNFVAEGTDPGTNPGGDEGPDNPGGGDNGNNGGNNNGGSTGGGSSVSRRDDDDDWEPLPNNNYRVTKKNDKPSQNTQIVVRDPADNSDNTSSNTGSDSGKHNPETGDTTTAFAAMALAAVSLGGVVLLGRKKK